jgi:uncharacterized protein YjbI with pentapeptide repeats
MPREVIVPVSKAQLVQYADRIKDNPALTLVEFIRNINSIDSDFIVRPQIKNLQFDPGEVIDLGGADLSDSIWIDCIFPADHITFKGKYWNRHLDRPTKLDTAEFHNCKFIGQDLSGVSLGQIEISSKFFENCRLTHTKIDPTLSKIVRIVPTIEQLKKYVELRSKKPIPTAAQESFSDYLHNISKHRYPKDKVIIADLSNLVIDAREIGLTGKETDPEVDFSRSDLRGAVLRGFKKIALRDCDLTGTLVEDCQFAKATDFRGSELSLMIIGRNCSFNSPKFSIPGDKAATTAQIADSKRTARARSREGYVVGALRLAVAAVTSLVTDVHPEHSVPAIRQAISRRLLPENFRSSMLVDGGEEIDFDPCYQRGSTTAMAKKSIVYIKPQGGIADVYAYRDYCHQKSVMEEAKKAFKAANGGKSPTVNYQWVEYLPNFAEFLRYKYRLKDANFVPDLNGLDLSGGFIRTKAKDDQIGRAHV